MAGRDLIALAAQRYQIPEQVLRAVGLQESGLNPNIGQSHISPAVGTERGAGMMQLLPSTARGLGVDPNDPSQAVDGAAQYLRQGYDKFGNWDDAVRYYHGGPDTKVWGPRTRAYHESVAKKIDGQPDRPANPFEVAPSGGAPQTQAVPRPQNPFVLSTERGSQGNDRSNINNPFEGPSDRNRGVVSNFAQHKNPGGMEAAPAGGLRSAASQFLSGMQSVPQAFGAKLRDSLGGVIEGAAAVPETVMRGVGWGLDKTGMGGGNSLRNAADWAEKTAHSIPADPNSSDTKIGNFLGGAAAVSPVSAIAPFPAAAGLAAKVGNWALQGGVGGTLLSRGRDVGENAAIGSVAAPALGVAVENVAAPAIGYGARKIGQALEKYLPAKEAPIASSGAGVASVKGPAYGSVPTGTLDAGTVSEMVTPQTLAKALGSNGARSGIEATRELPSQVITDAESLTKQGVPLNQALREADIRYIGGKPATPHVTRDPAEQSAMWEGAKLDTPEARALSDQIAGNNAALHNYAQGMVEKYGGIPSPGEAIQSAAEALSKRSEAVRAKVSDLYKMANAAEGDKRVSINGLRELLATPQFKSPTDAASKHLIDGIRDIVKSMSADNGGRFSPAQIDDLTQAANAAYDRMGGSVNSKIGQVKGALNESLDQLEQAGPAYKSARAAHKAWAEAYENPAGISRLIRKDAKGNFLNEDDWRKAERVVESLGDKDFIQIVRQLKDNGDTEPLNRIKATIIQKTYEVASNNAKDKLGNSSINGKAFFTELNKINKNKLEALFSKNEIADISTLGRASLHLNEPVPGTNNTSNTSSAWIKALKTKPQISGKAKLGARILGHTVAGLTHPGMGNLAVEGALGGAEELTKRRSAEALAVALGQATDPSAARAAQAAAAKREADVLRRRIVAGKVSERVAPVAAAANGNRR